MSEQEPLNSFLEDLCPSPQLIHRMRTECPDGGWRETCLYRDERGRVALEQTDSHDPEHPEQLALDVEESWQFGLAMSEHLAHRMKKTVFGGGNQRVRLDHDLRTGRIILVKRSYLPNCERQHQLDRIEFTAEESRQFGLAMGESKHWIK